VSVRGGIIFFESLKKCICLNARLICIESGEREKFRESFSHAKNLGGPLSPKKIVFKFEFIIFNQLGHTVSTKQTMN
jgi:hypothetical protein